MKKTCHELFLCINQVISSCLIQIPLFISIQHCIKSAHSTDYLTLFITVSLYEVDDRLVACKILQETFQGILPSPTLSVRGLCQGSAAVCLWREALLPSPESLPHYTVSLAIPFLLIRPQGCHLPSPLRSHQHHPLSSLVFFSLQIHSHNGMFLPAHHLSHTLQANAPTSFSFAVIHMGQ